MGTGVARHRKPARADWSLVVSVSAGTEGVCPRCLNLSEIAARVGIARPLA
jgi:hypothetical protein